MTTKNEENRDTGRTPGMFASLLVFGVMIGLILLTVALFPEEVDAGPLQISMTLATFFYVASDQTGCALHRHRRLRLDLFLHYPLERAWRIGDWRVRGWAGLCALCFHELPFPPGNDRYRACLPQQRDVRRG